MTARRASWRHPRPPPVRSDRYSFKSVVKDPLDLRDLMYQGSLLQLPLAIDNRAHVPEMLNQQSEGACTGFALAAIVNLLLARHPDREYTGPVSPRMLYEMAKRYDEWRGESYEGSSIRGAMKGWRRHGVCGEEHWRYRADKPGEFSTEAQRDALGRPLGNYFRVRHLHLEHMHSALREVGVLLASAAVHEGWEKVDPETGVIPFEGQPIGGHAFAIVGYDVRGFWIQNSWGNGWGREGFCHLAYDDWLENGWDCWAARLGVPIEAVTTGRAGAGGRALGFDYIADEAVVLGRIRPHFVNLGNDGRPSEGGRYSNTRREIKAIIREHLPARHAAWGGRPRLLLYAHGGLNSERASAQRIASFRDTWLANRIYPVHFMWETGAGKTLANIVADSFRGGRMQGWREDWRERFEDLLDGAIELGSRRLGRALWREMKENAERASGRSGGARLVAELLGEYARAQPDLELHLVAHSAGSILHAHLIPELMRAGVEIESLTLFAPACTTTLFEAEVLPHVGHGIERLVVFNLDDESERRDNVGPYRKSLLYLISRALEELREAEPGEPQRREAPILGMEKYLEADDGIANVFENAQRGSSTVIYSRGLGQGVVLDSGARRHGDFDNDTATLNATLGILLGGAPLQPFPDSH